MKQATPLYYILYDGIHNSVFHGQVLQPLLNKLEKNPDQSIYLISFERKIISPKILQKIIPPHKNLQLIVLKKMPYFGIGSLLFAARQLKKILRTCTEYQLIARGPLAGVICTYAYDKEKCNSCIIQARGLLAQEYAYAHADIDKQNRIQKSLFKFRMWQFDEIEKKAYSDCRYHQIITIEAVSQALKEYLITTFNTKRKIITVAQADIPHAITTEQRADWRSKTRTELSIAKSARVYCYNGSLKPWQCPDKVINYFKNEQTKNENVFLLILTQDTSQFQELLARSDIARNTYHVMLVKYDDIYRYLAACDVGILFREPHIVNWVSRPTKALEYMAVQLEIAHNNTVAWLMQGRGNKISVLCSEING